jgi:rhamnosyltransferase
MDFTVIQNGENLGIAAALNIGVRFAMANGFKWVALFDQDSRTMPDFFDVVMDCYSLARDKEHIGIVSGRFRGPDLDIDRDDVFAITSGSVIPLRVFVECGFFDERLFIDCVDDEYCLRLKRAGYRVVLTGRRVLLHVLGSPTQRSLPLTSRKILTANYGAKRRYYRNRNRVFLIARNWRRHPGWCRGTFGHVAKEFLKVLLIEDERFAKLGYSLYGMFHGLIGRMGRTVEL